MSAPAPPVDDAATEPALLRSLPTRPVLREGAVVLRDSGRLLVEHWPALVALACAAVVARSLVLELAVVASRLMPVLTDLVQALVPFVQVLAVVAMLLLLRGRHAPTAATPRETLDAPAGTARGRRAATRVARSVSAVVVASAAVLVPFLVVYEHNGSLAEDAIAFGYAVVDDLAFGADLETRLELGASAVVVVTVAAALVARRVLTLLVRRTPPQREGARSLLRLAAGYCEAVWIVLGAQVVSQSLGAAATWWSTRTAGLALTTWWQSVTVSVPHVAAWVEAVLGGAGLLAGAAVTAVLVPLAWLNLAAVVYGVEATKVLRARDLAAGRGLGAVVTRVGDARTDRALTLLTDPERRFGAVIGAAALIARAGWRPVLVVCLAFLVADNVDLAVWELARILVGPQTILAWFALEPFLNGIGAVLAQVLTLTLVASAANAILVRLGLPDALRLHRADSTASAMGAAADPAPQGTGSAA